MRLLVASDAQKSLDVMWHAYRASPFVAMMGCPARRRRQGWFSVTLNHYSFLWLGRDNSNTGIAVFTLIFLQKRAPQWPPL